MPSRPIEPTSGLGDDSSRAKDRYEVVGAGEGMKKRFVICDRKQDNKVVAAYDTLRQASLECSFLCLLHLQSQLKITPLKGN